MADTQTAPFPPMEKLKDEGYGEYLILFEKKR